MSDTFVPGAVVRLRSGGQEMTVTRVGPSPLWLNENGVRCSWFTATGTLETEEFPQSALVVKVSE